MSAAPGRRRAVAVPDGRSRWSLGWSLLAPLLLAAAIGSLLAWSERRTPDPPAPAPTAQQIALTEVTLVCPGRDTDGSVAVGVLPGEAVDGSVRVGDEMAPDGAGSWTVTPDSSDGPVTVAASGTVAARLGAWHAQVAGDSTGAGLSVSRCARPGADAWFIGPGSTVEHASSLVLSNPGTTGAVVDVALLTSAGEVTPAALQGVTLAPGSRRVVDLADVAAGVGDVTMRVRSTQGQVAAAVLDRWTDRAAAPAGTEWLAPATPVTGQVALTGVPAGTGRRELIVTNTGDLTAAVAVEVVGSRATFVPESLEQVEIPARSTVTLPLPDDLDGGDGLGLRAQSGQPLLATVRSRSDGRAPDVAYATATPALTGPTAVPVRLGVADAQVPVLSLAAAAPEEESVVEVRAHDAGGAELATANLRLAAGVTTTYDPGRGRSQLTPSALRAVAYLVLSPGRGAPVQAAAAYTGRDGGLSVLALSTPPSTLRAPVATPAA